jgi:hypothetical protein
LESVGHTRWFPLAIKHVGCKVDRMLYRASPQVSEVRW